MSKQRGVRLIIREIMDMPEYKDLSYTDILNIVYWSQYGFVHNTISNGSITDSDSYKSIRLTHMGSFIAHPKKIQQKIEYFAKKAEEKSK